MKMRVDFVTNSSSSSYITITATKKDGSVIHDLLESDGFPDNQIYGSHSIGDIVGPHTVDGNEILENIQQMYVSPRMDYLLEEGPHPLREIHDLKDLLTIEIKEEVSGDLLDGDLFTNQDGDFVSAASAQVVAVYDVQNDHYSELEYSATGFDDEPLSVILMEDEDWDEDDED